MLQWGFSVEILTPSEYETQTDNIHKSVSDNLLPCGAKFISDDQTCENTHFSILNKPWLEMSDSLRMYLRKNPQTAVFNRILVSTDYFGFLRPKDTSIDQYQATQADELVDEIATYQIGIIDGEEVGLYTSSVQIGAMISKHHQLIEQYNILVNKYNSLLHDARVLASFPTTYIFPSPAQPSTINCETTRSVVGPDSPLFTLSTSCRQQ